MTEAPPGTPFADIPVLEWTSEDGNSMAYVVFSHVDLVEFVQIVAGYYERIELFDTPGECFDEAAEHGGQHVWVVAREDHEDFDIFYELCDKGAPEAQAITFSGWL